MKGIFHDVPLHKRLAKAVEAGIFTEYEAFAIFRCCFFNEQIADESIGNVWREDVNKLLNKEV